MYLLHKYFNKPEALYLYKYDLSTKKKKKNQLFTKISKTPEYVYAILPRAYVYTYMRVRNINNISLKFCKNTKLDTFS